MRNLLILILIIGLSLACGNSKKASTDLDMLSKNFIFEIEIIHDKMPSPTPTKEMYAIIKLTPLEGTFNENWKIHSFKLDRRSYSTFDNTDFKGAHQSVYENTVRKIPTDVAFPCIAEIELINEKEQIIHYQSHVISASVVF